MRNTQNFVSQNHKMPPYQQRSPIQTQYGKFGEQLAHFNSQQVDEYDKLYQSGAWQTPEKNPLEVYGHQKTKNSRMNQDFHTVYKLASQRAASMTPDQSLGMNDAACGTSRVHSQNSTLRFGHRDSQVSRNDSINSMLSPLLGKYTAEEFHRKMVKRVCEKCEEEKYKPPQNIKEYSSWKKRKYLLTDLFDVDTLNLSCEHEYLGRGNDASKLARASKLAKQQYDNQLLSMGGFMSAKGRMGATKYKEKQLEDPEWTSKTYHIAMDLLNPQKMACDKQIKKVKLLEEKAINKPNNYMRQTVLHKGLWKHKTEDYQPPRNTKKIRERFTNTERQKRNAAFDAEMNALLV